MSDRRRCEAVSLGRMRYAEAFDLQRDMVERRKGGEIPDQLLFVEHPHVITLGRNGRMENVLASGEILRRTGIDFHESDRGGDVTYHGPGQIVGYPIFDLREWKRDVGAYVRTMEQALIDVLAEYDIAGERDAKATGVWVAGAKIAAIGVHISRWITSHGFALNLTTDLRYFQYIVPCGLSRPVTSMEALGRTPARAEVEDALARHFGARFDLEIVHAVPTALVTERVT